MKELPLQFPRLSAIEKFPHEIIAKIVSYISQAYEELLNDSLLHEKYQYFVVLPEGGLGYRPLLGSREAHRKLFPPIRPIAGISRPWQAAVEEITFASLRIKHYELDVFKAIFAREDRRHLLRKLHFDVVLPTYSDEECGRYETDQDRMIHDSTSRRAIAALFGELSWWSVEAKIKLTIGVYSPSDPEHCREMHSARHTGVKKGERVDIFHARYKFSLLHVTNYDNKLPVVACVRQLEVINGPGVREIHPSEQLALLSRLPNSDSADINWSQRSTFPAWNRRIRRELVSFLNACKLPPKTQTLRLRLGDSDYNCDRKAPVFDEPLCVSIHKFALTSALKEFFYTGPVHTSFFGPREVDAEKEVDNLPWQSLETLHICSHIANPTGDWYFEPANPLARNDDAVKDLPGHGLNTDYIVSHETMFRSIMGPRNVDNEYKEKTVHSYSRNYDEIARETIQEYLTAFNEDNEYPLETPNNNALVPLIEAFVRHMLRMPALKLGHLHFKMPSCAKFSWGITYVASQSSWPPLDDPRADHSRAQVFMDVHGWEPPQNLLDLFSRLDGEAEILYINRAQSRPRYASGQT